MGDSHDDIMPTLDMTKEMTYLNQIIKEVNMRIFGIVSFQKY
jgi:hypothetical protein